MLPSLVIKHDGPQLLCASQARGAVAPGRALRLGNPRRLGVVLSAGDHAWPPRASTSADSPVVEPVEQITDRFGVARHGDTVPVRGGQKSKRATDAVSNAEVGVPAGPFAAS